MRLHENKKLFREIIELTSSKEKIPTAIIEKDYYVVLVLKKLYQYDSNVVFIGGTALAKCFNIINRFSEDVDLCIKKDSKKGAQKQTHKIIEYIKQEWIPGVEDNNKMYQDFKTIFLNYGKRNIREKLKVENRIRLELLTFLDPFPIIEKRISPYIINYMSAEEQKKILY